MGIRFQFIFIFERSYIKTIELKHNYMEYGSFDTGFLLENIFWNVRQQTNILFLLYYDISEL